MHIRGRDSGKVVAKMVEHVNVESAGTVPAENVYQEVTIHNDQSPVLRPCEPRHGQPLALRERQRGWDNQWHRIVLHWALLKRGYMGVYHSVSPKHIERYSYEFAGRLNGGHDTMELLSTTARGLFGRRLPYKQLVSSLQIHFRLKQRSQKFSDQ